MTDSTGAITDTYEYDAFGSLLASSGNTPNDYRYTGEQFDPSLDQYYLRARYYDQSIGRFTQLDTWMGNNQDPLTLHKYLYTHADPVNNTDPTGHFSLSYMGAGMNVNAVLTAVGRAHTAISWMDTLISGDLDELDAKAVDTSMILSLLGGKVAEKFLGIVSKQFRKACNSFVAGTLVHTEFGLVPIENIRIGDKVWAYNEATGETVLQEVVHLIQSEGDKQIVDIRLENGEAIQATGGHPFYVMNEAEPWIAAKDLTTLDRLLSIEGDWLDIAEVEQRRETVRVYNLTVEKDHTYFVGRLGSLAHNASKECEKILKPKGVNFPSPNNVKIDFKHVSDRHRKGGPESTGKDLWPDELSDTELDEIIRRAYRYGLVDKTRGGSGQGGRYLVIGNVGKFRVEMWINTKTKTIETAYPILGGIKF